MLDKVKFCNLISASLVCLLALEFLNASFAQPVQSTAGSKTVTSKWKKDFDSYCRYTQSDDCITIDSKGFWWDTEQSLEQVWTKKHAVPISTTSNSKVAKIGSDFFCNKQPSGRGYLKCTVHGWQYTLYRQTKKGEFLPVRETLYYQNNSRKFIPIYSH